MFDTNKEEFILMLNCLDIKNGDDFTLDFVKFKNMREQQSKIQFHDSQIDKYHNFKNFSSNGSEIIPNSALLKKVKKASDSSSSDGDEDDDQEEGDDMDEEEYGEEYYEEIDEED